MVSVTQVASYIADRYWKDFGVRIDEMKLHKLLYLVQRECLVQRREPMFGELFHAWKYGPVMPVVRQLYKAGDLGVGLSDAELAEYGCIIDKVYVGYAGKKTFSLVTQTHAQYSWKKAREGYAEEADSDVVMPLEDVMRDADELRVHRAEVKVWNRVRELKGDAFMEQLRCSAIGRI